MRAATAATGSSSALRAGPSNVIADRIDYSQAGAR
jgi:hypothetical protein